MPRYRIKQVKNGSWHIQERAAFWWFSLHYGNKFEGSVMEFATLELAENSIDHYVAFMKGVRVRKAATYYDEDPNASLNY